MAPYPLNLLRQLKQKAETWARRQGVSLNQFLLWATDEKFGALNQQIDDPAHPQISYRRGASGIPMPVLRGTGLRVQTIAIANKRCNVTPSVIAEDYGLTLQQVEAALTFAEAHEAEIEAHIAREERQAASANGQARTTSCCQYSRTTRRAQWVFPFVPFLF